MADFCAAVDNPGRTYHFLDLSLQALAWLAEAKMAVCPGKQVRLLPEHITNMALERDPAVRYRAVVRRPGVTRHRGTADLLPRVLVDPDAPPGVFTGAENDATGAWLFRQFSLTDASNRDNSW